MKTAAVIILNWNGLSFLQRYLPVLEACTPADEAQLYVADNASTDQSVAWVRNHHPRVNLIQFEKNYGFAEGYNLAIGKVETEYVILLNSDVEVTPGWLTAMLDYMEEHTKVAACQPKICSVANKSAFEFAGASGGFIDVLGYPFCRGRLLQNVEQDAHQYDDVRSIFWASGACLCIRRNAYEDYGGLDARFFAHQEEIDLCWRLHARGRDVVVFPQSVVYHVGGGTLPASNPRKTFLNYRNNLCMLYKNLPLSALCWVMPLRFLLDYASALVFLLKGAPKDALAVLKARIAYHALRRKMRTDRHQNREKTIVEHIPTVYIGSLLWLVYVGRKKKFSELKW